MCGFISGQNSNGWNILKIKSAIELLNHRGPDSNNIKIINPTVMMAHARLSIVGIDNGKQPLHHKGIWAVVNGEFYNHEEIKKQLILKGFSFQTSTDSEILIFLYELYGVNCLNYLHGEFAFTLYDENKKIWFCARDRFGIRPLNWTKNGENFLFASEAKAMSPFINLSLNKDVLWFSQHFQYLPQDKTLFTHINMIKPAHYLLIENNQVKEVCYWKPNEKITNDNIYEAQEKIEHLLTLAIEKRIPNEVRACTHLSGGIDSSAVSYFSHKYNIQDSFTISFTDDGFYDELPFAKMTAQKIGSNLHIVPVNFEEILQVIPNAIYHAEGLSINGHLGAKYLLNQAIHKAGFKVALSGEGSDEIFMGYSHLKQDYLSKNSLNDMEKSYLSGVQLPNGKTFDLSSIENKLGFIPTWIKAKSSMAYKLSELWTPSFKENNINQNDWFIQNMDLGNYSNLKQSSFLWTRYCLAGYILKVLDDAQSMAFSVEGRLPFLDTELVDYVWSLPEEYYFDGNIEKNILRKIMNKKLPDEVVHKTKQSFMSPPITKALQNKKSENFIFELLNNNYFQSQQIYSSDKVNKQLLEWKKNPTTDSEPILMTMLSIASLCQEFKLS